MYRRERPQCQKQIERILKERQCTLEDLLEHSHRLSDGMRIQAQKMLEKKKNK